MYEKVKTDIYESYIKLFMILVCSRFIILCRSIICQAFICIPYTIIINLYDTNCQNQKFKTPLKYPLFSVSYIEVFLKKNSKKSSFSSSLLPPPPKKRPLFGGAL